MDRDYRIDFFRGVALLLIVANHIEMFASTYFFKISTKWLQPGLSDSAEIFVLLSGYVYGIVYMKNYVRSSFFSTYRKSLVRAKDIYLQNMLTLLILTALVYLERASIAADVVLPATMTYAAEHPLQALLWYPTLLLAPELGNVLPMYIVILLFAPFFLYLLRRSVVLGIAISCAIWVVASLFPYVDLPTYPYPPQGGWAFNPFAWQFLFVLGMAIANADFRDSWVVRYRKPLLWFSVAVLLAAFVPRVTYILNTQEVLSWHVMGKIPFAKKATLGPMRMLHFFSLLYVVAWLLQGRNAWFERAWARPVVRAGQSSLEVFCFGVLATYIGYYFYAVMGFTAVNFALVTAAAWAAILVFAELIHRRKQFCCQAARQATANT